MAQRKASIYKE